MVLPLTYVPLSAALSAEAVLGNGGAVGGLVVECGPTSHILCVYE